MNSYGSVGLSDSVIAATNGLPAGSYTAIARVDISNTSGTDDHVYTCVLDANATQLDYASKSLAGGFGPDGEDRPTLIGAATVGAGSSITVHCNAAGVANYNVRLTVIPANNLVTN